MINIEYDLRIKNDVIRVSLWSDKRIKKNVDVSFRNLILDRYLIISDWHMLINIYRNIIINKKRLNSDYKYMTNYLINKLKKEALHFSTIENVIEALSLYPEVIKFLDLNYTGNKEFMLKAVSNNGKLLRYASKGLKSDKDIIYTALNNNGLALRYILNLNFDIDIVRKAITQNGLSLRYASIKIKTDRKIIELALKQNGNAYKYLDHKYKCVKEIILLAIKNKCRTKIITKLTNAYLKYSDFIRTIIKANKNIYNFIRHLFSVKCFLTGSNHSNPLLKSNLLKLHSHGPYHANRFTHQILSYLNMTNDHMQILLYDKDDRYNKIPFYILIKSILFFY